MADGAGVSIGADATGRPNHDRAEQLGMLVKLADGGRWHA